MYTHSLAFTHTDSESQVRIICIIPVASSGVGGGDWRQMDDRVRLTWNNFRDSFKC